MPKFGPLPEPGALAATLLPYASTYWPSQWRFAELERLAEGSRSSHVQQGMANCRCRSGSQLRNNFLVERQLGGSRKFLFHREELEKCGRVM